MHPLLKPFFIMRNGSVVRLVREPGRAFEFDDESGVIEAALRLMDGSRDISAVAAGIGDDWPDVSEDDVKDLVIALDRDCLIEDGSAPDLLSAAVQARYMSNLAFFGTFASLDTSRQVFQDRLRSAHVLQLGVGGLGSSLLLGLAGSGVGRITLLDCDRVELKNLTRQFLYTEADVGHPKVECAAARARALNSGIEVDTVQRRVCGPADVADLLGDVDLVLCGIDRPRGVSIWVNDACAAAGVPMIVGGMGVTSLVYWSVLPGVSGCMRCWEPDREPMDDAAGPAVGAGLVEVNRALGPIASLAAGLVGVEALRYLTGFASPVSAGRLWLLDLVTGACRIEEEWDRRTGCPVCAGATPRPGHCREPSAAGTH
jgi:molybdopterin-synthase adenylyltransferase